MQRTVLVFVLGALLGGAGLYVVGRGGDGTEGERAVATSAVGPVPDGEARQLARLQQENESLRKRVAELEGRGGAVPAVEAETEGVEVAAKKEARDDPTYCAVAADSARCTLIDPPQAVLDRLAACGAVKYDHAPAWAAIEAKLEGMSAAQVQKIKHAHDGFLADRRKQIEELYVELSGDEKLVRLPPGTSPQLGSALGDALRRAMDAEEVSPVTRRVAEERAGKRKRPAGDQMSSTERLLRLQYDEGSDYEAALARALGAEGAHALHARDNGWGGQVIHEVGTCPE